MHTIYLFSICLSVVNSRFSPHLHAEGYSLSVRKQLRQVFGAKHIPQGGLSQQPRRQVCIVHIGHGRDGAPNAEVHHAVHRHRHRVFGQDLQG